MKKIISISVALLLVLSMFTGFQFTSTKTTSKSLKVEGEAVKGDVTYVTWRFNEKSFKPIVDAFKIKYPEVNLTLVANSTSVEQYVNMQKIKLMSGDSIDVTDVRPESLKEYVKNDYLLDLSNQKFLNNYNSSLLNGVKVNSKQYTVPTSVNIIGVYYNQDLFKKLNLKVPKTWNEFLAVCKKVKAAGKLPLIQGGKDGWPMEFDAYAAIQKMFVKNPNMFEELDNGKRKYTDADFVATFKSISDFYKLGYVYKQTLSMPHNGAETSFRQGKAAMFIQGEWEMQAFVDKYKANFKIGVFPLPYNNPGEKIVVPVSIGCSEGVVTSSKNQEAALKFVEFMSSLEGASILAKELATFSPVKGTPADFNILAKEWSPLLKMDSNDFFYNQQYPATNAEFLKQLQTLFANRTTPANMAKALQAVQDKKVSSK